MNAHDIYALYYQKANHYAHLLYDDCLPYWELLEKIDDFINTCCDFLIENSFD